MKKLIILMLLNLNTAIFAQTIAEWTEENGTLGLGYPVPIPVDTPEPFDGFRSYNGLFNKHQSMALDNPYITGHIVGKTVYNRDIWAYVLSDEDDLTIYGVKEGAMLINGGIHAREWQSPEVLTGIMELLNEQSDDHGLHQFLLENTTIVALPVNNVDGFLQTQRFPTRNWLEADSNPRDGRMRRKNMLDVDESLVTRVDRLMGVDLNRNNNPFWASSGQSSPITSSIVYHGAFAHSEPETRARLNLSTLVDADQIRVYTDAHSFSLVHFSVRTNNQSKNILQARLLQDFTTFHRAFPGNVNYADRPSTPGFGIGTTTEFYATVYEVPSWTLEIEPSGAGGLAYGGFGNNGHDGFILPEAEITRVREQLAQTFMITWYGQAGPPAVTRLQVVEKETDILAYDAHWDIQAGGSRVLFENEVENLIPGKQYSLLVSFDKPMRVRNEGDQVVPLQGQSALNLNPTIDSSLGDSVAYDNPRWINEKNEGSFSYQFYKDDTYAIDFTISEDVVLIENARIGWSINAIDMIGQSLDADPSTVVTWAAGQWQNYENSNGVVGITGGRDGSYSAPLNLSSKQTFAARIQPSGLYFDPDRSGEGFSYELLGESTVWLQWFTYDGAGNQRWYSGVGEYSGNKIIVNSLTQANGGVFGAAFDASNISFAQFGSVQIVFSGGEPLLPVIGTHEVQRTARVLFTDTHGNKLRTNLEQLSFVQGALNDFELFTMLQMLPQININPLGLTTASWYDPLRSGEGYIIEILEDGRAVLLWYTYDLDGNHMWLIDTNGTVAVDRNDISLDFNNVVFTQGGIFGVDFNADAVKNVPWGNVHFQINCFGTGVVNYASDLTDFGAGQHNIIKLTSPLLLPYACDFN